MRHAAIYARFSTELQNPQSAQDQIALCERWAASNGFEVVATFKDEAVSGTTAGRSGYQALLAAAEAPRPAFDAILCEATDRLWRDMGEQSDAMKRLRLKGVELIAVSQGLASRAKGAETQFAVHALVAQLKSTVGREQTRRGLGARFERGLSTGGKTFGYRALDAECGGGARRLVIDEAEASVVRRIWKDYADGHSLQAITNALNAEGIPFPAKDTKRGPARIGWAMASVRFILRNESYLGRSYWDRREYIRVTVPDKRTGEKRSRRRSVLRPRAEWRLLERPDLRIIDDETAARVACRIARLEGYGAGRARGRALAVENSRRPYLLTGLLRCGVCGSRMTATTVRQKKRGRDYEYAVYYCTFAETNGPEVCKHRVRYPKHVVEGALLERFEQETSGARLDALCRRVNRALERLSRRDPAREKHLIAEIDRATAEQRRLIHAIAEGAGSFASVRDALARVEAELATLTTELRAARDTSPSPVIHPELVKREAAELRSLLADDLPRAKTKIARHLGGDMKIAPEPSVAGERRARITVPVTAAGLLAPRVAPEGELSAASVAGARFGNPHTAVAIAVEPAVFTIDLPR